MDICANRKAWSSFLADKRLFGVISLTLAHISESPKIFLQTSCLNQDRIWKDQ